MNRPGNEWEARLEGAVVAGSGLIDGRPVMVGAEDFTTVAGTIGSASHRQAYDMRQVIDVVTDSGRLA